MARPKKIETTREREEALRSISQLRIDDVYVIGAAGFWLGKLHKPSSRKYSAASARREMLKRKIRHMAEQLGLDGEKILDFLNQMLDGNASSSSSSAAVAG